MKKTSTLILVVIFCLLVAWYIPKNFMSDRTSPFVVILLGPPSSGKGTQAKLLSQDFNLPQISTGDLFREHIAARTSIGQKAKSFIDAGQLVPDQIVLGMLFERIKQPDCANGYLLDGFPRTIQQAIQLNQHQKMNSNVFVLSLNVPDEEIVKRAAGRLVCRQCGSIYNRDHSPPTHDNICDKCGGEVYRRKDDDPDVVGQRLKVYHAQTQPLIEYYNKLALLTTFDGNQPQGIVHSELKNFLEHYRHQNQVKDLGAS
jgi:adenylate kinase